MRKENIINDSSVEKASPPDCSSTGKESPPDWGSALPHYFRFTI
jgi:hypothetical protein